MNITMEEYIANFIAIKGKPYADFMVEAAFIRSSTNYVMSNLHNEQAREVLSRISAVALTALALKIGITEPDNILNALDDCKAMLNASLREEGIY